MQKKNKHFNNNQQSLNQLNNSHNSSFDALRQRLRFAVRLRGGARGLRRACAHRSTSPASVANDCLTLLLDSAAARRSGEAERAATRAFVSDRAQPLRGGGLERPRLHCAKRTRFRAVRSCLLSMSLAKRDRMASAWAAVGYFRQQVRA